MCKPLGWLAEIPQQVLKAFLSFFLCSIFVQFFFWKILRLKFCRGSHGFIRESDPPPAQTPLYFTHWCPAPPEGFSQDLGMRLGFLSVAVTVELLFIKHRLAELRLTRLAKEQWLYGSFLEREVSSCFCFQCDWTKALSNYISRVCFSVVCGCCSTNKSSPFQKCSI